jgi:single-strand DNA-binding protein
VIVTGRLKQRTWEKDGQKQTAIQINADSIGVSTRWGPAKTAKALETTPQSTLKSTLGATEIDQPDEAPF